MTKLRAMLNVQAHEMRHAIQELSRAAGEWLQTPYAVHDA